MAGRYRALLVDYGGVLTTSIGASFAAFCLEAGAQAICFGIGSESNQLTDEERARVWTLASRHLHGAAPLIVATSHASREGTIALTRLAQDCGADCAMVNPQPRAGERLVALFRDLSERVGLPLMPSFFSGAPNETPSSDFSTTNALIPLAPSSDVRASTV